MKSEKVIKERLEEELEDLSIETFKENQAEFWVDFGFMKALRYVLRK